MQPNPAPHIAHILQAFCGADCGRSVAFEAYHPVTFKVAIKGDEPRPAASVMKVPLAMAVYRSASRGEIDLEARVPASLFPPTRYVSILAAFAPDHMLSVREICRLTLMTSDNPLAVHLGKLVGFDAVNAVLEETGSRQPCRMAAGFTEAELGPANRVNVLTAGAAARLLHAVWTSPVYADLALALRNNLRGNRIPALLPERLQVMHKTGSLEGVVNDVGIVSDGNLAFTLAFLCDRQVDPLQTSTEIARCALEVYEEMEAARSGAAADEEGSSSYER